jgi:hypothetical protein
MDIIQEKSLVSNKPTFFSHVFSTTEESKAEIMNVAQYAILAIIPVVLLNKTIQRFIPDADQDASTIELLAEVIIQILIIFVGLVIIHRVISYIPTYSGYKYEPFILTNSILTFLVIVLSLQTKLGLKVNMLYERVVELWTGAPAGSGASGKPATAAGARKSAHVPSQADSMDANPSGMFPPAPVVTSVPRSSSSGGGASGHATAAVSGGLLDNMFSGNPAVGGSYPTSEYGGYSYGPAPANSLLGSAF